MNKRLRLMFTTLLFAVFGFVAHAADETVNPTATTGGGSDFSWSCDQNTGATAPAFNSGSGGHLRLYAGNTMTISSDTKKLKKVELTVARNKHYWSSASVDAGTVSEATNSSFVWDADDEETTSFTITNDNTGGGNLQIQSIAVTYVEETVVNERDPQLSVADQTLKMDDVIDLTVNTLSDGAISFWSEDEYIAWAGDDGGGGYELDAYHRGTVTIHVYQEETDDYDAAETTFTVTVTAKDPTNLTVDVAELAVAREHFAEFNVSTNSDAQIQFISSDDNVAWVNEGYGYGSGTFNVYGYQPGTATITVRQDETEELAAAEVTFEVTVTSKLSPELTAEDIEMYPNAEKVVTISTLSDGNISFDSSDSNIAWAYETYDENSNKEYRASSTNPGTTTITVIQQETEEYEAAETTFTIKVIDPADLDNAFVKMNWGEDVKVGDVIIFVNDAAKKALSTTQNSNNRAATDITIEDGIAFATDATEVFTLEDAGDSRYYLKTSDGRYIYASSASSNQLKTSNGTSTAGQATIWFNRYNFADVEFNRTGRNTLSYNSANGGIFSCYASVQTNGEISVYRKPVKQSLEDPYEEAVISESTYATIYYESENLQIPDGVKAYAVEKNDNEIILHEFDGVIPAGQPAVINGEPGTYKFLVTEETGTEPDANDLVGSEYGGQDDESGYKYYVLSWLDSNKNIDEVGFYYQSGSKGQWASVRAHQAYLKIVQTEASANGYRMTFNGISDGIGRVQNSIDADAKVYTLSGTRVGNRNLSKGIYIINGKKVVIK